MIPELGHFALILALCLAVVQTVFPIIGAALGYSNWMAVARPAAAGQWVFAALAFICLTYCFVYHDFSVLYVANHSNSALPLQYRFSAVWGGHEGSLLLWVLILATWTLAVAVFSRSLPERMISRVLGVMGFISIGFLLFMLATSNPFDRLSPAAMDGNDLNPLLQDPGLIVHPPMLYMGYVGFSVAFSFAIAALLGGRFDGAWARWMRPWTTVAWMFLTLGIALGSWWAYYELGWGGWWFWDPVENASFMPWLVGTALIHSLAVTEKRDAFKSWTLLLAITAFSLSLLGTFLVRSGVLTSVHAFATDPTRGVFILAFLGVVIGISLTLYAWRAPQIASKARFEGISRETALLVNNVLLFVAAASVLIGTLYPLFLDALGLGKISVGPPYFDAVFYYLMAPLVIVLGVGSLVRWRSDDSSRLWKLSYISLGVSAVIGLVVPILLFGWGGIFVFLGITGAVWIVAGVVQSLRTASGGDWRRLSRVPQSVYAMNLAHLGMAVFTVGVTFVNTFEVEKDVRMAYGEPVEIGGLQFVLKTVEKIQGPNYVADRGNVVVMQGEQTITTLTPEKRIYRVQQNPMTEAAIDPGVTRDIYVALGEPLSNTAWSMRVYYKPFIRWIWFGALLMALGGVLAAADRRYWQATKRASAPAPKEGLTT